MEQSYRYFENKACKYYPCHTGIEELNCLFCFCPFYNRENCPGTPYYKDKNGKKIKVCSNCVFPHISENYDKIIELLKQYQ